MKAIKQLLGDSVVYGIGGLFVRATQIFILPLILIYLKKDEFGVLDYFLNIKNILIILYGWGILTSIFKYSEKLEKKSKSPFNGILIIIVVSFIGGLIISLLSLYSNSVNEYWEDLLYVHIISCFGALFTIPLGVFRLNRKPVNYVALNLFYTIVLLGSSYYLIITTNYNYKSVLIGHVLASSLSFIIGLFAIRKDIIFKFEYSLFKKMLDFGFSILLGSLSFVILLATSRFFLKAGASFEEVGLLGMAQRISLFVGALLISPFALAWLPFVKSKVNDKNFHAIANRVFTSFLWIGLIFTLTLELIQKDVFLLIGNKEYLPSLSYVIPFSISYLMQGLYFIFSAGIFLSGNTKHYKIIGLSSIAFNLTLYLLLYNTISIGVVSYITLLSFVFSVILAYFFGNKRIKIKVLQIRNILILLLYSFLFGMVFSFNNLNYNMSLYSLIALKLLFIGILFSLHLINERKVKEKLDS